MTYTFTLFKKRVFEVSNPEALIEAYCFQSDFYAKYDLNRPEGDKSYEYVRFIGARTKESVLEACKKKIDQYKDLELFTLDLDLFLDQLRAETSDGLVSELAKLVSELDSIRGVGLAVATKILHTRYPKIIPMIDNPLQKEYRSLKAGWRKGNWFLLFKDYYDNFLVPETYESLRQVHANLKHLGLSKVRIFDILWWSFLKSKELNKFINWTTIRQAEKPHAQLVEHH